MRVKLNIPDEDRIIAVVEGKAILKYPGAHGEHYAYHGQSGRIIAGAGGDGVWVAFDGMAPRTYVGCPMKWLERE